ncbi:MAG: porin [Flavobacteriales bacterium TMED96]|nr:MAG: porin [Flavobacteriales bacterium TMED96]|tara:strand:+ start:1215 stop:2264 length:1050 start_codon:yes stop_codon:yes gene_type:complete
MKNIKYLLYSILALVSFSISAQEETTEDEPTFSVAGSIDTYFRSADYAPGTSFANLPGFALGMANVILSYEGEKSGFVADFVYGPRGTDAVFASNGSSNIVNQLYAYLNVSDNFTLTLGNWNTFLGYEVISPTANFNYSTSYMFSYGPFSHTGIKADFTLSEKTSLMLGVMNQTDFTEGNFDSLADTFDSPASNASLEPFDGYMFGAQLGISGQYLNLLAGDGYTQIDFTGGFDLSESFFLGINATSADIDGAGKFSGVALYPQLALSETFTLGLRGEIFNDDTGILDSVGGTDQDNTSFTVTGSFTSGNLTIKPEFRIDSGSAEFYQKSLTGTTDNLASFVLAAIYAF